MLRVPIPEVLILICETLILENGWIPMGLFRQALRDGGHYVYTNPSESALVQDNDELFVLVGVDHFL